MQKQFTNYKALCEYIIITSITMAPFSTHALRKKPSSLPYETSYYVRMSHIAIPFHRNWRKKSGRKSGLIFLTCTLVEDIWVFHEKCSNDSGTQLPITSLPQSSSGHCLFAQEMPSRHIWSFYLRCLHLLVCSPLCQIYLLMLRLSHVCKCLFVCNIKSVVFTLF